MIYARPMAQEKTLTAERYRLLLAHLRGEYERDKGHDHGWKKHAADLLNVHRSMVSAIWSETKGVGAGSAEKAAKRMKLPPGFFMDPAFDAEAWLAGEAPRLVADSHVEPIGEHPHFKRARESGHYPDWVLKAADAAFFQRDGRFEYHELVRFMDAVHMAGEEAFVSRRPGPPKRSGQ